MSIFVVSPYSGGPSDICELIGMIDYRVITKFRKIKEKASREHISDFQTIKMSAGLRLQQQNCGIGRLRGLVKIRCSSQWLTDLRRN